MKVFRAHILVCAGTACVSGGSWRLKDALEAELERRGLSDEVQVVTTGCNGFCVAGPIMIVYPEGIFYQKVTPEDVPILVEEHILKGRPVPRLFYKEPVTREAVPTMKDIVFFGHQVLRALRNRGLIDPDSIDEYIARDGYLAIHKALTEMTPEQIIKEMKASGLRGRGGGGFPTGLKWEFCAKAKGDIKYVLCNADEGDPGAFMDRSILEADPHAVLEGMMIAGRAIGSSQGYIYVRAEYPLAIQRLYLAIKQAKEYGLLGEGILGTDFSFDIDLYQGAGAFVCGEETALMFSIEGKRGNPRPRPPFPAQKGLWNKPSILNNVETFANVPQIILNGAQWFASLGTEGSKGTKVFSLSGAVNNIGLVEVPMGTTLETIIYDIGGGIIGERKFKAVQIGGPSGGFLPASLLKTPVDYESINATGAIMGSGGMVVADETTCMVDAARFFLEFTQDESCGKCPPCRIGTKVMLDILTRITEGRGQEGDIELLEDLAKNIKAASLCGLGQTAPNPVLTTIRYFRDEYEAHIKYKRCPAVACKAIISSPCQHACPIDQDAPAYIGLIMQRKFQKAWELITEKNPLPAICGRVCHHPCERVCRRGVVDEPVAIRLLKRFVDDYEAKHNGRLMASPPPQREDGRVAIIGSGPAGLTAAHFLAKDGFAVTIFEALPVAGGMLAVGIPEYRLPKDILNREIERIKSLGVEIKLNSPVGSDLTIEELFHQGYKAIFIAVGAHKGLQLRIPGEEAEGVMDCVSFLRDFNLGRPVKVGKKVGVIGGGNAAIDAARTALRLGAEEVSIIYRRTRVEMPADKTEVDEAEKEGIKIVLLAAPGKILTENGKVTGIECIRMELGDIDASGRRRPVPIKGSEFTIELDTLIPAISQEPDLSFLPQDHQFNISKWNTFVVDEETMATNVPGVFAGGDAVTGPDTVVMAMRAGKIAAESIGRYLRGKSLKREYHVTKPLWEVERTAFSDAELEEIGQRPRMRVPTLSVESRKTNFNEVELGFNEETAVLEAQRCLRCDLEE